MITVKNLSKEFDNQKILHNISTTFHTGKTNLIIGRSGSGKTVLMKCITGLITPEEGSIYYDKRDLLTMNKRQQKNLHKEIGMLFQGGALFDSQTVLENVLFPLNMFSKDSSKKRNERALSCLDRVHLKDMGHLFPSEISGGMRKRVAIARAIALQPKYLFCDEPNSGLDPETSLVIDDLIAEITKEYNITTIINTHDMNTLKNHGEQICFIKQGEIGWQGTYDEIEKKGNEALNNFIYANR